MLCFVPLRVHRSLRWVGVANSRGEQGRSSSDRTAFLPQIKDEGIDVGPGSSWQPQQWLRSLPVGKAVELQISNVGRKVFHLFKTHN